VSLYFYSTPRKAPPTVRQAGARPEQQQGSLSKGRIVKLLVGQGHGFIRMVNGGEAFFHRADVREGASFNDFAVGDAVTFELLDDRVSGARALRVRLQRRLR
jgi:cold shock CspA family protein